MDGFSEADFQAMEQFKLKWRWAEDEKWNILPAGDLAQICPFTLEKAVELSRRGAEFVARLVLNPELFECVSRFDDRNSADESEALIWLQKRLPRNEPILVSWDENTAILTNSVIFCAYWDDFCYPYDQVLIWPLTEDWAMFHDEEQLTFGRLKPQRKG